MIFSSTHSLCSICTHFCHKDGHFTNNFTYEKFYLITEQWTSVPTKQFHLKSWKTWSTQNQRIIHSTTKWTYNLLWISCSWFSNAYTMFAIIYYMYMHILQLLMQECLRIPKKSIESEIPKNKMPAPLSNIKNCHQGKNKTLD